MKNKFIISHQIQLDQSDCGVTCLSTVINYFGSYYPIEELRELSGTNKYGTTMLGLIQAAQKIGLEAEGYEADIESLIEYKGLSILHIVKDSLLQHFIVCFGFDKEKNCFIISDPSERKITYLNKNELKTIWESKSLILLKETPNIDKSRKKNNLLKWIFGLIKPDANIIIMAFIFGIFNAVLGLSYAVFSQKFIDSLLPSNNYEIVIYGSLLFLFFLLFNAFITYLKQIFLSKQGRDTSVRLINFFFTKLIFLPKTFFDTRKIGDLIARMNDTNRIQNTITSIISKVIIHLLLIITSTISIFNYNSKLGFISLLWIPIYAIIVYIFHPKIFKRQRIVLNNYAMNESNYIDTLNGIGSIKLFNSYNAFIKKTIDVYSNYRNSVYKLSETAVLYQFVSEILGAFFIVSLIISSVLLINDNQISTGGIIAIIQLSSLLISAVVGLSNLNIDIQEARVAINRMFEFVSINTEFSGTEKIESFHSLEIKNLSFRFAGRSQLLKNINFKLNKGEWISIVGESGSGKSTLGQVLQKFYNYENGQIIVNGQSDFRQISTEDWRNIIGVIPQEINIFNGNVIENILTGASDSSENVQAFCRQTGFDKFITELPQGYSTILGEEGINLSGGQKQIIALARVLFKKPQFLILDEATAAMDRNTEKFTLEILKKIKSEVAILFISHRLHSLKNYTDRIYVLENGIISHSGTHNNLLQSENFYSAFWNEL